MSVSINQRSNTKATVDEKLFPISQEEGGGVALVTTDQIIWLWYLYESRVQYDIFPPKSKGMTRYGSQNESNGVLRKRERN